MSEKKYVTGHKCNNCGMIWEDNQITELFEVEDLAERLDPGSEVPSGECPDEECGALTYFYDEEAEEQECEAKTQEILFRQKYVALLEALKEAEEYFADQVDFGVLEAHPCFKLWNKARAAIAAAEGKEVAC